MLHREFEFSSREIQSLGFSISKVTSGNHCRQSSTIVIFDEQVPSKTSLSLTFKDMMCIEKLEPKKKGRLYGKDAL